MDLIIGEYEMVRHEAAEAIGAIGLLESLNPLQPFTADQSVPVRETVELAIDKIEKDHSQIEKKQLKYDCVDPAPPMDCTDLATLESILLNPKEKLFKRFLGLM
jgi:deoxyhypusine monooxygenase